MSWAILNYSKKAIRRAGEYLIRDSQDLDISEIKSFIDAHEALSNWRASHAYPIQSMLGYFRRMAFEVDSDAVIAQRLKRAPSIIAKLKREADPREGNMQLDRMEDIGGCRIVVKNISSVYALRDKLINGRTRNILHRKRDYIERPKESGYRGIHLIYKYKGEKSAYLGHSVELQIRSRVQHSWATAVEVVGTFTGQALKASNGQVDWLRFFKLTSIAFEDIENKKLAKNADSDKRLELISLIDSLQVLPKLRAFAVTTKHLGNDKHNRGDYFLLTLEISDNESKIRVRRFPSNQLEVATNEYATLEKDSALYPDRDVVLVAASSVHQLKKAYPNYFADTTDFSRNLKRIMDVKLKR